MLVKDVLQLCDKNMNISCSNKKKGAVDSGKELSDFPDPVFTNK